ncbi:polysaccharide pyruvyl transferase family protein [Arthrobacter sp. H5]|uniref:polysaccharide pyruvyl transferase family protein n=1 Tax=Arthrobacter sp. H5 TaxID=1267973 RepID=UPI00068641C1|nr:polysaccharide pyruvyl transferase family protein [Arthrobacter sp. H5]
MKRPLFYLVSCAGHPNYGDEIIAAGWLRFLAERHPEADIWLDCPNPGTASLLFEGIHPRLNVTNTLWRACWDAGTHSPDDIAAHVTKLVRDYGSPLFDLGLEKLRQADSLHLLGGGYLNAIWPHNAGLPVAMTAVREITGCRLYGTGLSLVPFNEDSAYLAEALAEFDQVSARDAPSAERYSVTHGVDDAFLAVDHELARGLARGDNADVVISVQSDQTSADIFDDAVAKAREVVGRVREAGKVVKYVEAIPGTDYAGYEALSDLIPQENFVSFSSVWKDGLPLREGQTWFTTRFHLHFIAAAAGAEGVAIGIKEGYYDIKHGTLLEQGTGWAYGTRESPPGEPSRDRTFQNALKARVTTKWAEADGIYPVSKETESADVPVKDGWLSRRRRP